MSVLIKGMKMPESCFQCPFRVKINPDDMCCRATMREFEETWGSIVCRHIDCPLVEVQDECDGDSCPIQYSADEFFSAERSDGR